MRLPCTEVYSFYRYFRIWYSMSNQDFLALEVKIDALIKEYKRLEQEKHLLQAERAAWKAERARLIKQNELARSRVETMIERLKAMEHPND
ncbi:hypothetical protein REIFOR_00107 [Reinekea forsetii]|uniref:Cell division protein ZapB n=2 Tax=Saccharospirillaceae TaxID=255527 RepID=A0A2K8KPK1_9GAMM|nr:hypothetical protein REIFOR_00107 [Reinekea forsetii]